MFVTHLAGMTAAESRPLLEFLYRRLAAYRFSCRFRWQPGGLLMWDNRFTLHVPIHDSRDQHRKMIWASTLEPVEQRAAGASAVHSTPAADR